ncbi:MAG TPA: 5'-3' exonuclease H3TH domain-containing protein [Patescibacteria group bacterium]|nr:5'-3' exonuclease H3TH domain-containing protein [Patescibacteria group bacterium]
MSKKLVLVDGHAVVFRAYYAFPATLTTRSGEQINAVYGFASILLNVLRDLKPTHVAVAFDLDKPTFRHLEYVDYKAQRPEVDVELTDQLERVRQVVTALNIPIFQVEGFEADDVIGTLGKQAQAKKIDTVIVTGDQDAMQLVNGHIKVYVPARGLKPAKIYGEAEVKERYGLTPKQIIDLKALSGDVSDNIPGIHGVGPKTATKLLQEYNDVDGIYKKIEKITGSLKQKLVDGYEEAERGKKLATIVLDVPITLDLKACELKNYDKRKVMDLFEELGFKSLYKRLPDDSFEEDAEDVFAKQMGMF